MLRSRSVESCASHAALRYAIERERITVLFLTASLWREWARGLVAAGERLPVSVRLAITAGEKAAAVLSHLAGLSKDFDDTLPQLKGKKPAPARKRSPRRAP